MTSTTTGCCRRRPLPRFLLPLRERAAAWAGIAPERFANALVAEYRPGTPLGWHRDVPDYEAGVGVSLAGTRACGCGPIRR